MRNWGLQQLVGDKVDMLADPTGELAQTLGVAKASGSYLRSAFVIDQNVFQT
eukprot:UN10789